jgi:hypothetical protein
MMQRNQAANIEGEGKGAEEDVVCTQRARALVRQKNVPFFRRVSLQNFCFISI